MARTFLALLAVSLLASCNCEVVTCLRHSDCPQEMTCQAGICGANLSLDTDTDTDTDAVTPPMDTDASEGDASTSGVDSTTSGFDPNTGGASTGEAPRTTAGSTSGPPVDMTTGSTGTGAGAGTGTGTGTGTDTDSDTDGDTDAGGLPLATPPEWP